MLDHFNEEKPAGGYYTKKTLFQEREELPDDRKLLMTAEARGKNAEAPAAVKENPPSVSSADRPKTPEGGAIEAASLALFGLPYRSICRDYDKKL